ncbi:MAG: nucleotidyltransferase domain-containing protein [Candidatus Bathyarchaeia archaeon]
MTASLKDALEKTSEFISTAIGKYGNNLFGSIVFGSLVKGTWRKSSDVDIILLFNKCNYSRSVSFYGDLKFEVYNMPLKVFFSPFSGDGKNLFFDMFRLQVLRTGKILYERDNLLSQLFTKLREQRISRRYLDEALSKFYNLINAAEIYLSRGRIEKAELSLRDSSINLARALLMKINIPEINTPRLLIPHLRERSPELYEVIREVYGLNYVGRNEAETRIREVKETLNNIKRRFKRNIRLKGVIDMVENELLSAEDCLEDGDYDSAILQAEFSQSILIKNPFMRNEYWLHTSKPNIERRDIKECIGLLREIKEKYL